MERDDRHGSRHADSDADGALRVSAPPGPLDPFAGDPDDPARELAALDDPSSGDQPLSPDEREQVLEDLQDLEVFQALLHPRGVRGLVVDCQDCQETHYYAWDLLRGQLRTLLDEGRTRVHEPAHSPDPSAYVSWDYARGFTDGTASAADDDEDEDPAAG